MARTGVHHLGLATLDIDRTIEFYTKKVGWEVGWSDIIEPPEGGQIKHVFFDTGDGSFVAFMCPVNVPGIPTEFATDINSAQHLPGAFYHFAFWMDTVKDLEARREELIGKGIDVTPVVDHEWARSIYFRDPNGLLLEYCTTTRKFNEEDKIMRHRDQPGAMVSDPKDAKKVYEMLMRNPQMPQRKVETPTKTPV